MAVIRRIVMPVVRPIVRALTEAYGALFTPAALFGNNEQGVWYDPSDIDLTWRRNLLTYTEQFDNAAWTKSNATIAANATTAPDGATTADKFVEAATASAKSLSQSVTVTIGDTYTYSVYAKKADRKYLRIIGGASSFNLSVNFDLDDGSYTITAGSGTVACTPVGNGWFRCSITRVAAGSTLGALLSMALTSTGAGDYTGDGTSGIYIWGAQLEAGSTASAYQRITDGVQDYYVADPQPVLFQDAAGTTPVTAVEQPVGLVLDKRKGLVLGSDFAATAGTWTVQTGTGLSGSNNTLTSSSASDGARIAVAPATGKWYEIKTTVTITSGSMRLLDGGTPLVTYTTSGSYVRYEYVDSSIQVQSNTAGATWSATISVRELPGNHAYQTASASRPVLSARVNLLTKTEEFSNAAWIKEGNGTGVVPIVTDNYGIAPDGTQTATRIQLNKGAGTSLTDRSRVYQSLSGLSNPHTEKRSIYMRSLSGTVSVQFSNGYATANTVTVTSDWQLFEQTVTVANALSELMIIIQGGVTPTNSNSCDLLVWHPDYRIANVGVGLPSYQRVNTATDYDTTNFPKYLRFDGVDDFLVTNSIDFTAGDKMTVVAGVRKLSDAAAGILTELSANVNTNSGTFYIAAPENTGASGNYRFLSHGSASISTGQIATSTTLLAPRTDVLTAIGSIPGDLSALRINGAENGTNGTGDQGTGNYGNYPLYIGRRGGTTLPFSGHLYGLIVRGAATDATALKNTETYAAGKVGFVRPAISGVPTIGVVL